MMADGWKNLEFLSPTFNHNSLDFYFQIISSLNNHSFNSSWY